MTTPNNTLSGPFNIDTAQILENKSNASNPPNQAFLLKENLSLKQKLSLTQKKSKNLELENLDLAATLSKSEKAIFDTKEMYQKAFQGMSQTQSDQALKICNLQTQNQDLISEKDTLTYEIDKQAIEQKISNLTALLAQTSTEKNLVIGK